MDIAVDSGLSIDLTWTSDNFPIMSEQRIIVYNSSGTSHQLTANITFSPVNTSDSGDYTCTAVLTAGDSPYQLVMATQSISIDVEGES